jgi:hypothetical protein
MSPLIFFALLSFMDIFPAAQDQQVIVKTPVINSGRNDFNFEIGIWKTKLKRLKHPLSGAAEWIGFEGTTIVSKLSEGKANIAELNVTGATGKIEGVSLRLYHPETRQWSIHFANLRDGLLTTPAIGKFTAGRGVFYNRDKFNGRDIMVRFVISEIKANSCHFEQAFSADGGKTWEINWIADDTRINR